MKRAILQDKYLGRPVSLTIPLADEEVLYIDPLLIEVGGSTLYHHGVTARASIFHGVVRNDGCPRAQWHM